MLASELRPAGSLRPDADFRGDRVRAVEESAGEARLRGGGRGHFDIACENEVVRGGELPKVPRSAVVSVPHSHRLFLLVVQVPVPVRDGGHRLR